MTTTENSRADALTACVHADDPKACYRVRCQLGGKCVDDDMSPRQPAPSPADERAALPQIPDLVKSMAWLTVCLRTELSRLDDTTHKALDEVEAQLSCVRAITNGAIDYEAMVSARAASANETGADGATQASEEFRQIALTELYEFQELTGCSTSDEYRAKLAAMAAEAVAIPDGYALVPVEPTPEILTAIWQNERDSRRAWERAIATVQQPAQADARIDVEALLRACVPGGDICDPQRIADSIREWFDDHGAQADARVGNKSEGE
ncbi:hypothetical protein [Burkholderia cenocepacia]|uniref:hypothetical protein n=1 Tax=Burkholderia cenocepacia TaxID=95486 RepID=UPI0020B29ADA|nr:hypothetical protein [Burkholderia cenocepacia]